MRENVTISHRGASYEIGRGHRFYGIWPVGSPLPQPMQWWPETDEGWYAAWYRFTQLESPAAIRPADVTSQQADWPAAGQASTGRPDTGQPGTRQPTTDWPADVTSQHADWPAVGQASTGRPDTGQPSTRQPTTDWPAAGQPTPDWPAARQASTGRPDSGQHADWPVSSWPAPAPSTATASLAAAGARDLPRASALASIVLLGIGVICGAAGLFGGYLGSASLASQSAELLPHALYLAAWTTAAVLIFLGGSRQRAGALLAAGVSAVTFGFFLADLGTVVSGGATAGSGLILSCAGWLACAAGSAIAAWPRPGAALGRPQRRGHQAAPLVTVILAGLGAAITFAPPWDSFTIRTASGATQTLTQGNAFGVPAPVIAGNVAVMIAIVAVIVAAGLWRPAKAGAVLLAGAAVPLVAQALSALVQASQAATPAQFGISRGEATALGISISSGLTLAFWIYCLFLVALALSCALLASGSDQASLSPHGQTPYGQTPYGQDPQGQVESGQALTTQANAPSGESSATDATTAAL